jgi:hypothetical protein
MFRDRSSAEEGLSGRSRRVAISKNDEPAHVGRNPQNPLR